MYKFYIDKTLLPIAPESLKITIANNNKTVTLINEGEVNILKRPGLSKIKFGVILPNVQYPDAVYDSGFKDAAYFLGKLEELKVGQKPFRFQVIRTTTGLSVSSFDTSFTVSLEDYEIEEDAEKYFPDVYVSITLLQYKSFVTKTITFKSSQSGTKKTAAVSAARDSSSKSAQKTYTVKSGDSLWAIAKKQLNNERRAAELYKLNKTVIEKTAAKHGRKSSSSGKWIYPGTVLELPK